MKLSPSICSLALVLPLVTTGCEIGLLVAAIADEEDTYEDTYGEYGELELQAKNGRLRGELGDVASVDDATTQNYAIVGLDWMSVSLFIEDGDASMMLAFGANGDDAQRMFVVGEEIELGDDAADGYGCSGESFEYEATAVTGRVIVEKSDEPDMVHLRVTLEFESGEAIAGNVDVAVPPS